MAASTRIRQWGSTGLADQSDRPLSRVLSRCFGSQPQTSTFVSKYNTSIVSDTEIQAVCENNGIDASQSRKTNGHVVLKECPFCSKPTKGKADNLGIGSLASAHAGKDPKVFRQAVRVGRMSLGERKMRSLSGLHSCHPSHGCGTTFFWFGMQPPLRAAFGRARTLGTGMLQMVCILCLLSQLSTDRDRNVDPYIRGHQRAQFLFRPFLPAHHFLVATSCPFIISFFLKLADQSHSC